MISRDNLRRAALPLAVFLMVTAGALLVIPRDNPRNSSDLLPTVVASRGIDTGTRTSDLGDAVQVVMMQASSRADGAISSVNEIPEGVLLSHHVRGQQLLLSSIARNRAAALGEGYVSVSIRLDTQRWSGPLGITGQSVDIYGIETGGAVLISSDATVLDAPDAQTLKPRDDAVVSFGIRGDSLRKVLLAASEDRIWLVGK